MVEKVENEEGLGEEVDMSKLSTAQKKKLKAKQKADAAKKDGAEVPEPEADGAGAGAKGKGKKGKGKKGPGGALGAKIAAQQAALAEQRAAEEQAEKDRIAAEDAAAAEEKRLKEEAGAALSVKREEERARIQALKDQGLWVPKKELAKRRAADARRKEMMEAGMIVGSSEAPNKTGAEKRDRKKNKNKNKQEEVQVQQPQQDSDSENEVCEKEEVKEQVRVVESQSSDEDWEDKVDEVAQKIVKASAHTTEHLVKEQEQDSEDENDKEKSGTKKTKVGQAAKADKQQIAADAGAGLFDSVGGGRESQAERRARQQEQLAKRKALQAKRTQKVKALRCPIICIMGHVDTGKTKILDKLRKTNVQGGEAGGITQQIGATYFPQDNLQGQLSKIEHLEDFKNEIPGFLVIDTPGHESFTNLRSRGSSLCDLAVLVIDIMHGLEQQTLESIQLLKNKNTPFCIALNKVDRLNMWESKPDMNFRDSLNSQKPQAKQHFDVMFEKTTLALNEIGFNVAKYWENPEPLEYLSYVPTSAITGEGMCDLMMYLCKMGQEQHREQLEEKDEFECTVLEVKVIEGLGTTVDVVLVNGLLKADDTIVITGLNGPIVTKIRALLTPFPLKEMRVKGEYQHHQKIKGAMGIKISAPGMEHAMAGGALFRCSNQADIDAAKEAIEDDLIDIMEKFVDKTQEGVVVQASTIGSLEALLEFLKSSKVPVSAVNIGPVHKKDIMKALKSVSGGEHMNHKEYATVLAFDVRVEPAATKFAEENEIKVFTAQIIYHLFDQFTEYTEQCAAERKADKGAKAVFPVVLDMVKGAVFNAKGPIIIGVDVKEGVLKAGTPLVVPDRECVKIGKVESIEINKKAVKQARHGDGYATIKLVGDSHITYGRHFDDSNQLVSLVTRDSIDSLKEHFRDEMRQSDWQLIMKLKKQFLIN